MRGPLPDALSYVSIILAKFRRRPQLIDAEIFNGLLSGKPLRAVSVEVTCGGIPWCLAALTSGDEPLAITACRDDARPTLRYRGAYLSPACDGRKLAPSVLVDKMDGRRVASSTSGVGGCCRRARIFVNDSYEFDIHPSGGSTDSYAALCFWYGFPHRNPRNAALSVGPRFGWA
jgi:hypothetical protein